MHCHSQATPPDVRHGWLLVGLIILLTSALFAFAGFSLLLTHHLRVTSLRQNQTKAIALAQAGIMQALFDVRFNTGGNGFFLGEYPVPSDTGVIGSYADDDVFVLGGEAADFLLTNMISGAWANAGICGGASNRQRLQAWTLRNVLLSSNPAPLPPDNLPHGMPVTITSLQISWQPDNGELVYRVDLMGNTADYNSCVGTPSGGVIPVNQSVAPNTQRTNRIWFSRRTTDAVPPSTQLMNFKDWIQVQFTVSNGSAVSTRRVRFLPTNPTASSANFTVKAVGEVRKGAFPFRVWRRLQAEYRVNPADPSNLQAAGRITTDAALLVNPPVPTANQRPGQKELTQQAP